MARITEPIHSSPVGEALPTACNVGSFAPVGDGNPPRPPPPLPSPSKDIRLGRPPLPTHAVLFVFQSHLRDVEGRTNQHHRHGRRFCGVCVRQVLTPPRHSHPPPGTMATAVGYPGTANAGCDGAVRFWIAGGFYSEVALRSEKQKAQCVLNTSST
jgi:hypothetical protein